MKKNNFHSKIFFYISIFFILQNKTGYIKKSIVSKPHHKIRINNNFQMTDNKKKYIMKIKK